MESSKKQPKAMFYVPGIIAICIGMAVLGIETPDRTVRFGADFYTETYQAIAEVSHVIKTVAAYVLFALGTLSLGRGITEAKRSDLVLEEMEALRKAVEELKVEECVPSATKAAVAVEQEEAAQEPTGDENVVLDGKTDSDEEVESVPETISTEEASSEV